MEINLREYDKYRIEGKIVDINDRSNTLTISVTSPFVSEIEFQCYSEYYDVLHPPVTSKYNWIDWVAGDGHPSVTEASVYYNINDKCFYKKESGSESEWECIDFQDIYTDNPYLFTKDSNSRVKFEFFLYRYKSILHKEQLCRFSAYATESTNEGLESIKNNQVERHPNDYDWIYDPDTFQGKKWDTESIDGLVKEIRPSRDCLKQLFKSYKDDDRIIESIDDLVQEIRPSRDCVEWLIESYKTEDREAKRKEEEEKRENKKNKWKNRFDRLEQYPNTIKIIITVLITTFVNQIPAMFKALKYIVQLIRE